MLGLDAVFAVTAAWSPANGTDDRAANARVVVMKRFMAGNCRKGDIPNDGLVMSISNKCITPQFMVLSLVRDEFGGSMCRLRTECHRGQRKHHAVYSIAR